MLRLRGIAVVVLLCVSTAACDQRAAFDAMVPQAEVAFGKQVFELLRTRRYATLEPMLDPEIAQGQPLRAQLEGVAGLFPPGRPEDVRVIGVAVRTFNDLRTVELTYEYEFERQWLISSLVLRQVSGRQLVSGLRVTPTPASQEQLNRFTFAGKSTGHYAMFVATAVVPLFILASFVLALRSPIPRVKWMWALLTLIGIGQVSFNWTTGAVAFNPVSFQLLGSGYFQPLYGPVTLAFSFPAGAIAFLLARPTLVSQNAAGESAPIS